ncbi:hypothetical protein QCA50_005614 [Cerrena zonata]|uniref:Uncharacterized protein n=1 Tax=Cerrena zonata TaxID=2478898 RepID=A0AAW0GAU8_9APHY
MADLKVLRPEVALELYRQSAFLPLGAEVLGSIIDGDGSNTWVPEGKPRVVPSTPGTSAGRTRSRRGGNIVSRLETMDNGTYTLRYKAPEFNRSLLAAPSPVRLVFLDDAADITD